MDEDKTSGMSSIILFILLVLIDAVVIFFAYLYLYSNNNLDYSFITNNLPNTIFFSTIFIILSITLIIFLIFTARRRTQVVAGKITEDLLNSRELFLQLFNRGPIPYLLISKDGKIQLPNRAALRLYKATAEQLEDKYFFDLHPEDNIPLAKQLFEFFNRGVPVKDREIQILRNDKTYRWVIISIFPLKDKNMKVSTGLITLVDITERKRIDKAKTEFVSLASHQLRTPLAAVKWNMEMLLSGYVDELSDKLRQRIQKIYDGNERMIEIVNMLLKVSRLELGTLFIKIEEVYIPEISDSVLEDLQSHIQAQEHNLNKQYETGLPTMKIDKGLLRMILQNLLSNAVKYTPKRGKIDLSISREGENIKIIVADNGYGIPKEDHDRMFTKLFRADNIRAYVADGTGLGLYIVKAVVELLGGKISFVSEKNKGATFTVILPIEQQNQNIEKKYLL